ncbi:MAG: hypothetical protein IJ721_03450 [Bacteroidales bacterium]|nr:hypothetical protein [Bacteroidales bacterium]
MFKSIFPIMSGLLVATTCLASSFSTRKEEVVSIPVHSEEPATHTHRPHAPATRVFEVWLDTDLGVLTVSAKRDVGEIDYILENSIEGEEASGSFDSPGAILIPISGTSGLWTVTFTLESGVTYYGEFEL